MDFSGSGAIAYDRGTLLLPWLGDRAVQALRLWLEVGGLETKLIEPGLSLGVAVAGLEPTACLNKIERLAAQGKGEAMALASSIEDKAQEKYDEYLPASLLAREHAARALDLDGAWRFIETLVGDSPSIGGSAGVPERS